MESAVLAKREIYFVAKGLDTAAKVYLNQVLIGNVDNMFIRYKWPVKQYLQVNVSTFYRDIM